jgi:hypothetical protein
MKIKTNLVTIIVVSVSTLFACNSSICMQGIQTGNLVLHNSLNEPVAFQMATILNGIDPETGLTITNGGATKSGTLEADSQEAISSGINYGGGDLWGSVIYLSLQRQSTGMEIEYQLYRLGTYLIALDEQDILSLSLVE